MAGSFNRYLGKVLRGLETVSGKRAKDWSNRADVLREAAANKTTPIRAKRMAKVENGRTFQSRIKAGVGGAAVTGAGFLGMHKYHQHQDNKILAQIDKMYGRNYNSK
ncbi:hypothetical protein D3C87_280180 [compost metagenome]